MKRSITGKIILVLLLATLFFPALAVFSMNDEQPSYEINSNWMQTSSDTCKAIDTQLSTVEKLGMTSKDDGSKKVVFETKATFEIQVLTVQTSNLSVIQTKSTAYPFYQWYFLHVESLVIPTEYTTTTTNDISFNLSPVFPDYAGQYLNGQLIKKSEHVYNVDSAKLIDVKRGECGDVFDTFTGEKADIKKASAPWRDTVDSWAGTPGDNIGFKSQGTENATIIEPGTATTESIGKSTPNKRQGKLSITDSTTFQPRIEQTVETFDVTWELNMWIFVVTTTDTFTRISALTINKDYVVRTYELETTLQTIIYPDADDYDDFIKDPYIKKGEWVFQQKTPTTTEKPIGEILSDNAPAIVGVVIVSVIALAIVLQVIRVRRKRSNMLNPSTTRPAISGATNMPRSNPNPTANNPRPEDIRKI